MSEPHLLLGRLLGLVQQMGSSHWIVLPKPLSRKGRESAEDTMLSKPQQQLKSGRGAPGPRVAAHRDLVEHILQRFHEAAEDNSTWEHVAWHCWLFITAQAPSIQEKIIWEKSGEAVSRGRCWVVGRWAFAKTGCHCWNMSLGQDSV